MDCIVSNTRVANLIGAYCDNAPFVRVHMKDDPTTGIDPSTKVIGVSLNSADPAMEVEMPCGEIISFKRFNDIPEETLMCPCGNSKHIVLEYRKLG